MRTLVASLALVLALPAAAQVTTVDYASLTGGEIVGFDDIAGGSAPGTNYDSVFVSNGVGFGDHFVGQTENHRARARRPYWEMASRSKYALCPRGAGTSTVRIFEMMEACIAPVIVADDWLPPLGPSWEEFALFVPESEISSIYEKVKAHEGEFADRGRLARQAWEQYFSPENYWSFLLRSIRRIQENQRCPELIYARSLPLLAVQEWGRQRRIRTSIRLKSGLKKCFQKVNADSLRYGAMLQ